MYSAHETLGVHCPPRRRIEFGNCRFLFNFNFLNHESHWTCECDFNDSLIRHVTRITNQLFSPFSEIDNDLCGAEKVFIWKIKQKKRTRQKNGQMKNARNGNKERSENYFWANREKKRTHMNRLLNSHKTLTDKPFSLLSSYSLLSLSHTPAIHCIRLNRTSMEVIRGRWRCVFWITKDFLSANLMKFSARN